MTIAVDNFPNADTSLRNPLTLFEAVVKSDSAAADQTFICRALYVGVSGDVVGVLSNSTTITLTALAAGIWHPVRFRRINSTSTTATNMVFGQ